MKLFYNFFSPNCRKVLLLVKHIRADVELVTVDLRTGGSETPEFLALNPNGRVPTLMDGDFALWESNAILQYIAEKFEATQVWPNDLRARALVTQWQLWETNHFGRAIMNLGFENYMKKLIFGEGPDEKTVTMHTDFFRDNAKVLEAHLAKNKFLAGPALSLADFALAGAMQFAERAEVPLREFPRIADWFERMKALDAWKLTEPKLLGP